MQPLRVGPPSRCAGLLCWQVSCKLQASISGHVLFTPSFIEMGSLHPDCSLTWAPGEGLSWRGSNSCSAKCVMVFLLNVVTKKHVEFTIMAIFSVWFSSVSCIYIVLNQTSRTFSSSRRESPCPAISVSQFLPTRPWQPGFCFLSVGLPTLDIEHKGNHAIFVPWWWTCLTGHKIRVHPWFSF